MNGLGPMLTSLVGAAALASCNAEPPPQVGACVDVEAGDRIAFMMVSKLPEEGWERAAGYARTGISGERLCIAQDDQNWPRETDTAFAVQLNHTPHPIPDQIAPMLRRACRRRQSAAGRRLRV